MWLWLRQKLLKAKIKRQAAINAHYESQLAEARKKFDAREAVGEYDGSLHNEVIRLEEDAVYSYRELEELLWRLEDIS